MLKTGDNQSICVNTLTIDELANLKFDASTRLYELLRERNLGKNLVFFKADYSFGQEIINNHDVFLPLAEGKSIPMNHPNLPKIIKDNLGYTLGIDNPIGILLNHESEYYKGSQNRIISYGITNPGQIFGYAHILDQVMKINRSKKYFVSRWNLNAGARLAFILAKISQNGNHNNLLKAYGINVNKPTDYMEHNHIFKKLNQAIDTPWTQSVLYPSRKFFDNLVNDKNYSEIQQFLSGLHRSGYNIWHSDYPDWENDINKVLAELNLNNYSAYAVNIVKHIYLIVAGGSPGFIPAVDENMLPKELIEIAYTSQASGYGLTEYWPTIMQPAIFDGKNNSPVYYGINLPTLINYNPETFGGKTTIALLDEVCTILTKCQKYILKKFNDRDSLLYESAIRAEFSFYHGNPDPTKYGKEIKSSTLLPEEDARFYKNGWNFPSLSQFVRGCIKIEPVN